MFQAAPADTDRKSRKDELQGRQGNAAKSCIERTPQALNTCEEMKGGCGRMNRVVNDASIFICLTLTQQMPRSPISNLSVSILIA